MSQFAASQNPFGPEGDSPMIVPERTSKMAISSLVCSLVCCIPVITGTLGVLLGIGALIRISSSRGRLSGRGLAIAGIVIGLLVTSAWVGGGVAASKTLNAFVSSGYSVASAAHSGDPALVRAKLSSSTTYTDEQIKAFSVQLNAKLGNLKPQPAGPLKAWGMYSRFFGSLSKGGAAQPAPGRFPGQQLQNEAPLAFDYDNGPALLLLSFDGGARSTATSGAGMFDGMLEDIAVLTIDGTVIRLSDMTVTDTPGSNPLPGSTPKQLSPSPTTPTTPARPSSEG